MLWIQSDSEWWAESIVNIHCHKKGNKKDIWRSKGLSAMSKIKVEEDGRMFKTKTWINESEQDTRSYQEFEGRSRYESLWREMEPHSVFCYVFLCYVAQIRRWYIFSMYSYVCIWTCSFLCTMFLYFSFVCCDILLWYLLLLICADHRNKMRASRITSNRVRGLFVWSYFLWGLFSLIEVKMGKLCH